MTDITHESHFAWQVQYLVTLEEGMSPVAPRIVNGVSYATGINHACHCTWQVYLVSLVDDTCCSAHCK